MWVCAPGLTVDTGRRCLDSNLSCFRAELARTWKSCTPSTVVMRVAPSSDRVFVYHMNLVSPRAT